MSSMRTASVRSFQLSPTLGVLLIALLVLASGGVWSEPSPQGKRDPDWAGSESCKGCHETQYQAWRGSHHDLAMQVASKETVLGNFNDAVFTYAGYQTRFHRQGDKHVVETEGPDGKLADFEVAYVFGVYPLQQYLIPLSGGRLQALSIAWDTRPREEGGQRWFHLYPEENIVAGDPLHWTGPYQNWNLQCAECHSTNLQKNYDPDSRDYRTTWSEIDVACEACHGPGRRHVSIAEGGKLGEARNAGFPLNLAERGRWNWPDDAAIARRQDPVGRSVQVDACGRCHARRASLGPYTHGRHLLDTHRVSLLREPLYHVDGQILDEVYVYGSFLQSKMYRAGVVCSNCHDPHTAELRLPGNGVCTQCHKPDTYDTPRHHHHRENTAGAACVSCHMPLKNYMVVDPRRDHSMRVPRPDLSVTIGTPNACSQCHSDRDAEWALNRLRDWGVNTGDSANHPARAFHMVRRGDSRGVPGLLALASDPDAAPIWRATAMLELGNHPDRDVLQIALELLDSEEPMLRWGAAQALAQLPLEQRFQILEPHFEDSSQTVRLEIALSLAGVPLDRLSPEQAAGLEALFDEYRAVFARHADIPETGLQLGLFFAARRHWAAAEQAYQRAIEGNPQLLAAYLNQADLFRAQGRDSEGRKVLLEATRIAPDQGAPWHALGLLEVRSGNREQALVYLEKAASLERSGVQLRYVYAIALHDNGKTVEALDVLKPLLRETPENPDLLLALATYSKEQGRREEARRYAARLLEIVPGDPGIRQLYDSL